MGGSWIHRKNTKNGQVYLSFHSLLVFLLTNRLYFVYVNYPLASNHISSSCIFIAFNPPFYFSFIIYHRLSFPSFDSLDCSFRFVSFRFVTFQDEKTVIGWWDGWGCVMKKGVEGM